MTLQLPALHRTPASAPRTVREVAAVALVVAVAVTAFAVQWQGPRPHGGTSDSYWYALGAARLAGASPQRAAAQAGTWYCEQARSAGTRPPVANRPPPMSRPPVAGRAPAAAAAVTATARSRTAGCAGYRVVGVPPRYRAIFDSRPGFALAAALPVVVLGLGGGLLVTAAAFFVLVALAGFGALRVSGVGRRGAVAGAAALCLLPVAGWDSRVLAEGAARAGLLTLTAGAVLLLRRPGRAAALLVVGGLAWTFAAQPAQAAAAALALVVVTALVALRHARRGGRAQEVATRWRLTTVPVVAVCGTWWALSSALHLPSLTDTVQDLATRHFRTPDIDHPLLYLLRRAAAGWWQLLLGPAVPWALVLGLPACALLLRWLPGPGPVWTAVALSALVVVSAHPLRSEYPRLVSSLWIAVAAAAAVAVDRGPSLRASLPPSLRATARRVIRRAVPAR